MLRTIALAFSLLAMLCAAGAAAQAIPIRIGWLPDANGAFFIAKNRKLFEQVGLDPTYFKFLSGPVSFAALQSASIDVAEFGVSAFVAGVSNGIPMVAIGVAYDDGKVNGLVARPGSGIKSVADLKGKKVAVTRGSLSYLGLVVALQKHGIAFNEINYLNVPLTAMIPGFRNGDFDAAWTWEPWAQLLVADGGQMVATLHDYGVGGDVWAARKEWLAQQPEAAVRFIHALDLAAEMIKADPSITTPDIAEAFSIPPALAKDIMALVAIPTVAEQLSPDSPYSTVHFSTGKSGLAASIRTTADAWKANGLITSFPPLETVFDPRPIQAYANGKKR